MAMNQIKSNQIKSNQIESNRIESNQIKSNRIEPNQNTETEWIGGTTQQKEKRIISVKIMQC